MMRNAWDFYRNTYRSWVDPSKKSKIIKFFASLAGIEFVLVIIAMVLYSAPNKHVVWLCWIIILYLPFTLLWDAILHGIKYGEYVKSDVNHLIAVMPFVCLIALYFWHQLTEVIPGLRRYFPLEPSFSLAFGLIGVSLVVILIMNILRYKAMGILIALLFYVRLLTMPLMIPIIWIFEAVNIDTRPNTPEVRKARQEEFKKSIAKYRSQPMYESDEPQFDFSIGNDHSSEPTGEYSFFGGVRSEVYRDSSGRRYIETSGENMYLDSRDDGIYHDFYGNKAYDKWGKRIYDDEEES